ncbi:MAG: patatin-like phospholipase family protein [Pseudomonadota bacterium]
MAEPALRLLAGPDALKEINRDGLSFARVRTVAGASGGPKWLVLAGLDHYFAAEVVPRLAGEVALLGSSIGAWRNVSLAQTNPSAAVQRFERAYIEQRYTVKPTPAEVTAMSYQILSELLGDDGVRAALEHPVLRQSIVTVRCRRATASDRRLPLAAGLLAAASANFVRRDWLGRFFTRAVFHDPRSQPVWLQQADIETTAIALNEANLVDAVVASGSIPFVLSGVRDPAGAPSGVYRDGGVIDYHLDLPLSADDGIALFPHFYSTITPGWFDKRLTGRHGNPAHFRRVLLLAPSAAFVDTLPGRKIPDRTDFTTMSDDERIAAWRTVVSASRRLADEFAELVEHERLGAAVEPLNLRRTQRSRRRQAHAG